MIKVKIDSTTKKYRQEGIKEFENLQHAIWYCWKISNQENVIVQKPFEWDIDNKIEKKPEYEFELEIYDGYRE